MYNLKINTDQGKDDDTSARRTSNSKPSGTPDTDKDFKKIMGDKDRQGDENKDSKNAKFLAGVDAAAEYEEIAEANAKPKQPSLFDLSKGTISKKANDETSNVVNMASADELPMESPTSIFKNLALKEKAAKGNEMESAASKMDDKDEEGKIPSRFPQESIDLSYVNPLALNVSATAGVEDQKISQLSSAKNDYPATCGCHCQNYYDHSISRQDRYSRYFKISSFICRFKSYINII